ncbi:MAG: GH116 family glycosyl-hydrolase [Promethearchaeota archaeon]
MFKEQYEKGELFKRGPREPYQGKFLNQISFPLGGIGTGCIGLDGLGGLRDFEIFNRPNVGTRFPKIFPLIRTLVDGKEDPIARVLMGPMSRPYTPLDGGRFKANAEGFPHMDSCEFRGEFPFAWIDFKSDELPVSVSLEAYNPFIPSNADASSMPIAILTYHVKNITDSPVEASILWSFWNIVGFSKEDCIKNMLYGMHEPHGEFVNIIINDGDLTGVLFNNFKHGETHPLFGSIALVTPDSNDGEVTCTAYWKPGPWFSSHYHIWNYFKKHGGLEDFGGRPSSRPEAGAVAIKKFIRPGETKKFTFYITWYFPNFTKYWTGWLDEKPLEDCPSWKNYYATLFSDAFDVASRYHQNAEYYHETTMKFHDALFGSTLPTSVLDAISSNISILKTPTCIRLTDGTFYGWEGCHPTSGCCEGTCTHVWGYQQALPFLFPSLQRSVHNANYRYNFVFDDVGALEFRIQLPLGKAHHSWPMACADGQLGGVMHVYREWKISGDDDWLLSIWPSVKRALEFAWEEWDPEKTGVLRGFQHNTYDVEFEGPNPMLTGYYLGALKAASEMAKFAGEDDKAREYLMIHEKGRKWVDDNLFNDEYYIQIYDPEKTHGGQFQVGPGCLIDQLVGQEIAEIAGLGRFIDEKHVKTTLKSIFKYNWRRNMRKHENGSRLYAVNDEAGTIICTWPKGGRPEIPFPYADEVMNGFEYQFATHCIIENLIEEGITIVKSIRDRYDGWGRNPWNEFECGHHYARSMASYGLLVAFSGFEYDKSAGYIGFDPVLYKDDFKTFWSLDGVWGVYEQKRDKCMIEVLFGSIRLRKIKIAIFGGKKTVSVKWDDDSKEFKIDDSGLICFTEMIVLSNAKLTITPLK